MISRKRIGKREAERSDLPQIARLFRVIAFSEEIHGERASRMLKEIRSTEENLKESFEEQTRAPRGGKGVRRGVHGASSAGRSMYWGMDCMVKKG